ncbi:hypothetical protein ACFV2X_47080, partial [Streptomyces sp. NPDC059679]|uniref:hypothetical protein n=1 Tax=Streptomyces sp. NPDC059679 TaxID=3346903 RepID=UPI0036CB8D96
RPPQGWHGRDRVGGGAAPPPGPRTGAGWRCRAWSSFEERDMEGRDMEGRDMEVVAVRNGCADLD